MHSPNVFQNHNSRQHSLTESPLFLPAPARNLTESPNENPPAQPHRKSIASSGTQTETDSQNADMQCSLFLHNSRQHSLTISPAPARTASQKAHMRTCQHGLTESQSRQGQTHRKPTCSAACFCTQFPPLLLPASARTASQKVCIRTRQHRLTESFVPAWATLKVTAPVGDVQAPAGMPRRL